MYVLFEGVTTEMMCNTIILVMPVTIINWPNNDLLAIRCNQENYWFLKVNSERIEYIFDWLAG